MLGQARTAPDYAHYLAYIFTSPQLPELDLQRANLFTVRYSAAIQLKNHIKSHYKTIEVSTLSYVKARVLLTLQDSNPQLRSFAGTVITEIVQQGGLLAWPEILHELLSLVGNDGGAVSSEAQEGAMSALSKVCEDNRKLLDREFQGQRPLTVIIPRLLENTQNTNTRIRLQALKTLKVFIPQKPPSLIASIDVYLSQLFRLSNDESTEVRRVICQSLVLLVDARPELLAPHMDGLVNYILTQQQNSIDADLALDAAEFWLSMGDQDELRSRVGPYLAQVIPVLLQSMIYGEDDVIRLGGDEDNADEEDRTEDLRPQFAQSKAGRGPGNSRAPLADATNGHQPNGYTQMSDALSEGEIEDEEDEEVEEGDPEDQWNLRKCSAAALDVFAVNFNQPVFEIILPYLRDNLAHAEWPRREAAVLALGAIADGCMGVVAPHLPELVPFLISLLNDPEPTVRQITCWCLGRYSEWAAHLVEQDQRTKFFEPMMEGLLNRMLDRNKKVQEAGASAFASLEEKSGAQLLPYTEPILTQFVKCFAKYKDRNMYILYDCVQTLAESVMSELAKPNLIQLLMPVLIERWSKVDDQSREMFPLLGCLGYIAAAYGNAFAQFAPNIFSRCIKVLYSTLTEYVTWKNNPALDRPDMDFVVTTLDLISATIQAVNPRNCSELVATTQPPFFDLLAASMQNDSLDVKQSAYALLGDCAIKLYSSLETNLEKIMPVLIRDLDFSNVPDDEAESLFNVLNNVCWSSGELSAQSGLKMSVYAEALYQGLTSILQTEEMPESVNENAAMAVGRLGIGCSEQLALHLPEYAEAFLSSMAKITATQEKASSFLGFNRVVQRNPTALERCLPIYFTAIATFPKREMSQPDYQDVRHSFENVSTTGASRSRQKLTMFNIGPERLQAADTRLSSIYGKPAASCSAEIARYIRHLNILLVPYNLT